MSPTRPPSLLLCFYYGFLLVTTALGYGYPYPLWGAVLTGGWAKAAVVADCLVLLHIALGCWRAQRLSWFLLLGYNAFELLSLGVSLAVLGPAELEPFVQGVSMEAFYWTVGLSAALMIAMTALAVRRRGSFVNRDIYLF